MASRPSTVVVASLSAALASSWPATSEVWRSAPPARTVSCNRSGSAPRCRWRSSSRYALASRR